MTLRLITARAGAGKTQHVVTQIRFHCENKPLPRILVVLPTASQKSAFHQRLAALARPLFGVTLCDFPALYGDLLDGAGALPNLIREPARRLMLRSVVGRLARSNHLPYLAPIADKPGLIRAVSQFISDLKWSQITPDEFAESADTPRLRDLATIYWTLQDLLRQRQVVDEAEMGWLAQGVLQANPTLGSEYDYIAADGFDEFNPVQVSILNALGRRVAFLDVTMTYQPRRLAHLRFARAVEAFGNATCLPPVIPAPVRVPALEHLEEYLFEPNPPRASARRSLTIVRANNREQEVRGIAREVKQLLVKGIPPSQIAVLFPDLGRYRDLIGETCAEYGIPVHLAGGLPLNFNPAVAALLNLLSLSLRNYSWKETLDAIRSPFFRHPGIDAEMIAQIAVITRQAGVTEGRQAWLNAFVKPPPSVRREPGPTRLIHRLSEARVASLHAGIEQFMRAALPERGKVEEYVDFVEALIGSEPREEALLKEYSPERYVADASSLRMIECIWSATPELAARDLNALLQLKQVLHDLAQATNMAEKTEIPADEFLEDLTVTLAKSSFEVSAREQDLVLVSDFVQGRGIPKDWVLVGGLAAGEFPVTKLEDHMFDSSRRENPDESPFPPARRQLQEQMSLFYEAATLARQHLYLFSPSHGGNGQILAPSPYIQAVQTLYQDLEASVLSTESTFAPAEAASGAELLLGTARALKNQDPAAEAWDRALRKESAVWRHSLWATHVESCRLSSAPLDEYGGVIKSPALRTDLAERFGPSHLWNVDDFDDWARCGFRFFARSVLALHPLPDPRQGPTPSQLDMLYHQILEKAYRRFASQSLVVTDETLADAQSILDKIGTRLLASAPAQLSFAATAWWEQEHTEMIHRLKILLAAEAERNAPHSDENGDIPTPVEWESAFGLRGSPPLRISLQTGPARIAGLIDRIDKTRVGMILIDYTTSPVRVEPRDILAGWNLRLPLFAMTAKIKGYHVADACFLHIPTGETSGNLGQVDRELVLEAAKGHVERYVLSARKGIFPVRPVRTENGLCAADCEFASLCRAGRGNPRKEVEE